MAKQFWHFENYSSGNPAAPAECLSQDLQCSQLGTIRHHYAHRGLCYTPVVNESISRYTGRIISNRPGGAPPNGVPVDRDHPQVVVFDEGSTAHVDEDVEKLIGFRTLDDLLAAEGGIPDPFNKVRYAVNYADDAGNMVFGKGSPAQRELTLGPPACMLVIAANLLWNPPVECADRKFITTYERTMWKGRLKMPGLFCITGYFQDGTIAQAPVEFDGGFGLVVERDPPEYFGYYLLAPGRCQAAP